MNTLAKTLLAGVAGTAMLTSAALAQNSDENNILSGVTSTVTDTVDSTIDTVDDVTGNVTNDLGVDDVTNDLGVDDVTTNVTDTVDDVTTGVTGGDVTGGDTSVDGVVGDVTGGDSSIGNIGSFSDLVGNIESGNTDVSDVSDISEIWVVDVQDAFNDFDANALNDVLSGNSANISDLQNSISGNQLLSDSLNAGGIDVSDIVAIENNADNSVTIYTIDRS